MEEKKKEWNVSKNDKKVFYMKERRRIVLKRRV
jgi:hypothetical protein